MLNLALFGVGSYFSSFAIASYFIEDAYTRAAIDNNYRELEHQKSISQILGKEQ